jgi:hypothetical protein
MINIFKYKKLIVIAAGLFLCSHTLVRSMIHELQEAELSGLFPKVTSIEALKDVAFYESQLRLLVQYNAHKKVPRYTTSGELAIAGGQELLGLTSMHRRILTNCIGKFVLDVGSATGLMVSKMALNAKAVQARRHPSVS